MDTSEARAHLNYLLTLGLRREEAFGPMALNFIKEKNFETEFKNIEELFKELGKTVRAMPQIKINGDLIGGYNQLVEYFEKQKLVNFRGEIL